MKGHIHKRVRSIANGRTSTTWYAVIDANRGEDGRRRQKWHGGFGTRKEAESALAKIMGEVVAGRYVEATKVNFADWIRDTWLPSMKTQVKASTWDSYDRNLRLHVLPRIGRLGLQAVTPQVLNSLYADILVDGNRRSKCGLSPKTVRYLHSATCTPPCTRPLPTPLTSDLWEPTRPRGPKLRSPTG